MERQLDFFAAPDPVPAAAAPPEPQSLLADAEIYESVRKIVAGYTREAALQQDLLQECLLSLWKVEREKPGRSRSWYLQNCRFHVQHTLAAGRSVDSHKRGNQGTKISIHDPDGELALEEYHTNGELFESVSFQDLFVTLSAHLNHEERSVLAGLADGLTLREAAWKSGLSYPTALKYRRRIARLASRLLADSLPAASLPAKLPASAARIGI